MFFTRTQKYQLQMPKDELSQRLIGSHVSIHDLDFEVYDNGESIEIAPHAENVTDLKTLPVTEVSVKNDGRVSKLVITSRMRKIDSGGPMLIVLFSGFLIVASLILLLVGREREAIYTLLGISSLILTIFWVRMELGYFDYVRKVQHFVKARLGLVNDAVGAMQVG